MSKYKPGDYVLCIDKNANEHGNVFRVKRTFMTEDGPGVEVERLQDFNTHFLTHVIEPWPKPLPIRNVCKWTL